MKNFLYYYTWVLNKADYFFLNDSFIKCLISFRCFPGTCLINIFIYIWEVCSCPISCYYVVIFVGHQLCWKDHLVFSCNAVCTDVCMYVYTDVRSRQHQKVNLCSLMRTQWPIFVKLGMWVVGDTSTTHVVCRLGMCIFNTSFAYLFWLANNKKIKYPEYCMGYIDETWYVGSDGHKYYPCVLSSPNAHI